MINKIKKFAKKDREATNRAYERMCVDIIRLSKIKVPHGKTGILESSGRYRKIKDLQFVVEYGQEGPSKAYARYQEYGGDGKRVVRNYTKAGSGKAFLREPADQITRNALHYLISEKRKIKV
ncbi:MAG: hypothetical protein WC973_03055 [Candidatus Dojkabacteria bacterium]